MFEKLTSQDRRFLWLCVLALAVFGVFGVRYFQRAFPEAAIELKVTRDQARPLAAAVLARTAGAAPEIFRDSRRNGWIHAARFATEDEPRVYLERTLGLERANRLYGRLARVWSWDQRWFRSGQKEEWRASITPLGEVIGFEHVLPESAAGARLDEAEARRRATAVLTDLGVNPDSVRSIEATSRTLPGRTDWTLVSERIGSSMGEATVRYRVVIAGDRPASYREFLKLPERWQRDYRRLRSANEATGQADSVLLLITFLAMIAVLVQKTVRGDVPWKLVTSFGVVAFALAFLSQANALPISLFDYDTASPFPAFLTRQMVLSVLGALAQGLLIAIVVGAAEPVYRERFPDHLSVRGTFSRRGLGTRGMFKGIVLGYAMTAFFLAYQVAFYIVADRFGAWAPADVPYDNLLNTAFPWATVLLIGFLPAVSEEFLSRIFSISFLSRYLRYRWLVVVIPALIWGFGHSTYPNQPFFIRGLEVGLAGILVGAIFLRWGIVPILVWHFSVDAGYTSLLMLRSGNLYYVVSGAIAAGALLVPFGLALIGYLRRGGFEPEAGLRNADEGVVVEPATAREVDATAVAAPVISRVSSRVLATAAMVAAVLLLTLLIPARPVGEEVRDTIGRASALSQARAFLVARGIDPDRSRHAIYTGTGFADETSMEEVDPDETGHLAGLSQEAARYVLEHGGAPAFRRLSADHLPVGLWVARFFRPGEKAEYKVGLDAGRGRPVVFAFPIEEADSAGSPPSLADAEQRTRVLARQFGYPIHQYALIDTGVRARPKRVDTRLTFESAAAGVAEARPRLTAVFHGDRPAGLWPTLKVPEAYLRLRKSHGATYWIALVARLAAGGYLLSTLLIVVIASIRGGAFRWRRILPPVAIWIGLAGLAGLNSLPTLWRIYPTEIPLTTYQATMVLGILVRLLVAGVIGLVLFGLIDAAFPGWRPALRRSGSWKDAFARAAIVAAGFTGVRQIGRILADRLPAAFDLRAGLPMSLESIVPGFDAFMAGAQTGVSWAAGAAAIALALRHPQFQSRRARWIALALILVLLVPLDAKNAGELFGPLAVSVLALGWTIVAAGLLRDHAAAWVLTTVYLVIGRGAAPLLQQGAGEDRLQGMVAIVLALVAAIALTAGRRAPPETIRSVHPKVLGETLS